MWVQGGVKDVAAEGVVGLGVGLVVLGGVDVVFGEDFAGVGVGGDDVLVVDEEQDGCAGVGAADAEVAHRAGVA